MSANTTKINIRHALYITASVVGIVVPVATTFHLINPIVGLAILKIVALFGGGAAGTAAIVLGQQKKDGTLDFQGTAAEQAIAAIQAVANQVTVANADVARVNAAVTAAAQSVPVLGSLAEQAINALPGRG